MSDDFFSTRLAKYMDVHKNNPPYTYRKKLLDTNFFYEDSLIMSLFFCSEETARHIVSALNQAYLEGWLNRQAELDYQKGSL